MTMAKPTDSATVSRRPQRVVVHSAPVIVDKARFGGDVGRFGCDRDQRGLSDGGAKSQRKSKRKQPTDAATHGKAVGQRLAEGEEALVEALHEQRQPYDYHQDTRQSLGQLGEGLTKYQQLKKRNDYQYRRDIAQTLQQRRQ